MLLLALALSLFFVPRSTGDGTKVLVWYNKCNLTLSSGSVVDTWQRADSLGWTPEMEVGGVSGELEEEWRVDGDAWYVKWWDVTTSGPAPPTVAGQYGDPRPIAGYVVLCNGKKVKTTNDEVEKDNCHWPLLGTVTEETETEIKNDYQWTSCGAHL